MDSSIIKRAIFFLNGNYSELNLNKDFFQETDLVVGVDGGTYYLLKKGLKDRIDYIIGDFDSLSEPEKYFNKEIIVRFDKEKDYTDALGAFLFIKNKYKNKIYEYHFYGVSGNREDHFLSIIFSFYKFKEKIIFHSLYEDLFFLHKGSYKIKLKRNSTFSIFPIRKVKNIKLNNTKYIFSKNIVDITGMGVSNIALKDEIEISFDSGVVLISILMDKNNNLEIISL